MSENSDGELNPETISEIKGISGDEPLKIIDEIEESFEGISSDTLDNLRGLSAEEAFLKLKEVYDKVLNSPKVKSSYIQNMKETLVAYDNKETVLSSGAVEGIKAFITWAEGLK